MSTVYTYEIRKKYEELAKANGVLKELKCKYGDTEDVAKFSKAYIDRLKKEVRKLHKLENEYLSEPQWRLPFGYENDDYGHRALYYCEDYYMNPDEVKAYKEENWWHWYNPYGDGRDCTGVWFTSYIRVFPIKALNKTIVYHVQCCDV